MTGAVAPRRMLLAAVLSLAAVALTRAQDPAFEVVSIKANRSVTVESGSRVEPGGRYTTTNTPLEWIILGAWGLDEYQLVGAPAWVLGDHFDIVAKANEELAFPRRGETATTRLQLMSLGPDLYTAGHVTMPQLVETLKGLAGRPVVDRTGLAGAFDLELHYSEDQKSTDLPSLYAALQEQLGLKLNTVRGQLDVLVVDSVGRPTPD